MISRHALLLAERSVFRDMGNGFREKREHFDASDLFFWFLIVVGVFVVIGILARVLARQDKHQLYNSPRALFRALCRAHGLDRSARRLLHRVARSQQIQPPARVFLEPELLSLEILGAGFHRDAQALATLRSKLFDGPYHSAPAASTP